MKDAAEQGGLRDSARRLCLALCVALLGLAASAILQAQSGTRVHRLASSGGYDKIIATLLAIGLFASAFSISVQELRRNARVVLVAITLGVAVKAVLTGSIMAFAYGSVGYLLLGVAVAQIDPLSVAATLRHSTMSSRAKAVLTAWASFDDPVTVLLVVYLASFALPHANGHGPAAVVGADAGSYLKQVLLNAALIAAAAAAWYFLAVLRRDRAGPGRARNALLCLILCGLIAVAVRFGLLVGITICGLFFRPSIDALIARVISLAFYAATFLLGTLLVSGADLLAGLLLGVSVFIVQMLAGYLISYGMPHDDRVYLSLGQQNGLTAIVLALALQPYLPAAVGIIAIAVLTVNILHITSNGIWELKLNGGPGSPRLIWEQAADAFRGKPRQQSVNERDRTRTPVST